jgi:hypothetical protein
MVLCLGAGYHGSQARKGNRFGRSPVLGLTRYLARFIRVVLVNEHNTSARCSRCVHGRMSYDRVTRAGSCDTCDAHGVDRDVNAASQMLRLAHALLATGKRPAPLRRRADKHAHEQDDSTPTTETLSASRF